MFIVALFIMARSWEQLKCLSAGEWINVYVYSGVLFSYNGHQL